MKGATKIAFVAAIGNFLQGWDNGAIAGSLLYLKPEFHLEANPMVEGLVVAATLIGAACSTFCSGPVSDWLGRKKILIFSASIYFLSACLMLCSPSVYVLIPSRFLLGTAIGLVCHTVPIFISESAPSEIRGQLATFPQLLGSSGLALSGVMVFGLSLTSNPSWRFMLGVLAIPALIYLLLVIFYVTESPRWLVSKGRMIEATKVLQRLRDREDVSGELALLVEGLGVGGAEYEEWVLRPAEEAVENDKDESQIKVFGSEEGTAWIATPLQDDMVPSHHNLASMVNSVNVVAGGLSNAMLDPMVSFAGSLQQTQEHHEQFLAELDAKVEEQEDIPDDTEDDTATGLVGTMEDIDLEAGLRQPLLNEARSMTNAMAMQESIGSGWTIAWQWTGPEGTEGDPEHGTLRRVYLLQETPENVDNVVVRGSTVSLPGLDEESFPTKALVGQPQAESYVVHPSMTAIKGPAWSELLDSGVKRALLVGVTLQFLQQFSGISAVIYFIPQILKQSGADALLSKVGIGADSASLLGSAVVSFLMLPFIFAAMRLMDRAGRRQLLLATIPVLLLSLIAITFSSVALSAGLVQAVVTFVSVSLYGCFFVMGFGPIPNILCAEIFPTKVRGLCNGICLGTFWASNIVVSYLFPILLVQFGVGGVFSMFGVVCLVAWVFIFHKVPETKGMPLEVISEFFAMSYGDAKKGM